MVETQRHPQPSVLRVSVFQRLVLHPPHQSRLRLRSPVVLRILEALQSQR